MKLDDWTNQANPADAARRKRLTIGYLVGAGAVALGMTFITYSAHGRVFEQEETIDVSLAKAPVIDTEPEVQPESTPPKQAKKRKKHKSRRKLTGPPKDIPDTVPEEMDPAKANPYEGDMDDLFDGDDGGGSAGPTRVAVNRKPARKAKTQVQRAPKPALVSERAKTSAPVAISRATPKYPEAAREQGVEATVIVRFVVGPDGSVRRVKIIKGHPLLDSAVAAAVRSWRFKPGTYEGHPVSMWRSARFPFRLSG